jgi:hypothetical protein
MNRMPSRGVTPLAETRIIFSLSPSEQELTSNEVKFATQGGSTRWRSDHGFVRSQHKGSGNRLKYTPGA